MTITFTLFRALTLVAIWLIYMGLTQCGVAFPAWVGKVAGVVAIAAGVLIIIGF